MGYDRDREPAHFEWVNTWAALSEKQAASAFGDAALMATAPKPAEAHAEPVFRIAAPTPQRPSDQLLRDIAEIERTRDALAGAPQPHPFVKRRRTRSVVLVPSRTSDSVPVMIGGVFALVILTVFGAAAAFGKFSR